MFQRIKSALCSVFCAKHFWKWDTEVSDRNVFAEDQDRAETGKDDANHNAVSRTNKVKPLKNISDIRRFFHRNETPIYFISATNFNLLGISEWVRNFRYINYLDCFDGRHPMVRNP